MIGLVNDFVGKYCESTHRVVMGSAQERMWMWIKLFRLLQDEGYYFLAISWHGMAWPFVSEVLLRTMFTAVLLVTTWSDIPNTHRRLSAVGRKINSTRTLRFSSSFLIVACVRYNITVRLTTRTCMTAFDTVPHRRLLYKFQHYGITGPIQTWIKSWLTKRHQKVVLDGECSDEVAVESGLPQGTVLGPLRWNFLLMTACCTMRSTVKLSKKCCNRI